MNWSVMEESICFATVVAGMFVVAGLVGAFKNNIARIINPKMLGLEADPIENPEVAQAEWWGNAASGSMLAQACPNCQDGYIREWKANTTAGIAGMF